MKALGTYIFAGGFTLGVRKHFDVQAHFEMKPGLYKKTVKANFPDLPIYEGEDEWPRNKYKDKIDFVYCNPPCAPWSNLGSTQKGAMAWKKDPRIKCWEASFNLLKELRPKAIAIESVPRVYSRNGGYEMIRSLTNRANRLGYYTTHLLIDGGFTGLNHSRKRFFFIATQNYMDVRPLNFAPLPTTKEVLDNFKAEHGSDPGFIFKLAESEKPYLKHCKQGESLRVTWERFNPPETWVRGGMRGGVKGRPQFMKWRMQENKPIPVIAGGFYIHPSEDRLFGHKELAYMAGYPVDYKWEGPPSSIGSQIARGVMPPVAEYVARIVKDSIKNKLSNDEIHQVIDFRKEPEQDRLL
jgi:site-specific DNA-cytosine methylase